MAPVGDFAAFLCTVPALADHMGELTELFARLEPEIGAAVPSKRDLARALCAVAGIAIPDDLAPPITVHAASEVHQSLKKPFETLGWPESALVTSVCTRTTLL